MTLLAEPETEQVAADESAKPAGLRWRAPKLPKLPTSQIRRIVVAVVVALVGLVLVWLICADPVAHVWYQSRQKALTNQVLSAGTQLGSQVAKPGDQVGVLQDPTHGLNVVIAQGDTPSILRGGPGHRIGTPLPGTRGNSVVVGHAKDWGEPFRKLSQLTVGSTLYLQARAGAFKLPATGFFIYTVTSVKTAPASDTQFMAPSNDYRLTLVTNSGSRLSGDRVLVVTAISGRHGKVTGRAPRSSLEPPGSSFFGGTLLRFLVEGLAAGSIIELLRRRHHLAIALVVATPVALLAVWSLFLQFDMVGFRPLA